MRYNEGMKICIVENCDRTQSARGLCTKCYCYWRRNGTNDRSLVTRKPASATPPETRIWKYVNKLGGLSDFRPDLGQCWLWTGNMTNKDRYGRFYWSHQISMTAHRATWTILKGEIPEGLQIDHLCRVKRCVNPDHLEPVTPSENSFRKYRATGMCGSGKHSMLDEKNRKPNKGGTHTCRECHNERNRAFSNAKRKRIAEAKPPRTHCKRGHSLTEPNSWSISVFRGKTRRSCRTCKNERTNERNRKIRALKKGINKE